MTLDDFINKLVALKALGYEGDTPVVLDVDLAECHSDRNILEITGAHIEDELEHGAFPKHVGLFIDGGKHV